MHKQVSKVSFKSFQFALSCLAFLVMHTGLAFASDDMSAFRTEVIQMLKNVEPGVGIERLPEPLMLKVGGNEVSLSNIYQKYRELPGDERKRFLESTVPLLLPAEFKKPASTPEDFNAAKSRLRIQIAPVEYVAHVAEKMKKELPHRKLSRLVISAYAVDSPNMLRYVTSSDLDAWKVSEDDLRQQAIANLDAASTNIELKPSQPANGAGAYLAIGRGDGYMAARILCPQFMQRVQKALGTKVMIGIPNRDFLVMWSPDFAKRRQFAAQVAADFKAKPHPLTPELLVFDEKGLRPASSSELGDHGRK
ncbi:MAG: DUF1444 family protein [Hyphomicrobiaceae bacterium]